jgi:hypothetical protein
MAILRRRRGPAPVVRALATGIAWARVGIGAGVWASPRGSMWVLGFESSNPQVMALARLAGTRDLALGGLAVATLSDRDRAAEVARINAGVDALDSLAFAIALLRRQGIDRAALMGAVSAAGAAAAGMWLARELKS